MQKKIKCHDEGLSTRTIRKAGVPQTNGNGPFRLRLIGFVKELD